MSLSKPNPLSSLQALKLTTLLLSGILTGASASLSVFVVPRLLESPVPLMLRQWVNTYHQGKHTMIPLTVITSTGYFLLASRVGLQNAVGKAYLAAGVLTLGIMPYTKVVMMGTNDRIEARAKDVVAESEEKVWVKDVGSRWLVDHWGVLNLGRAGMLVVGAVLGFGVSV
ncbi:hypothetical protein OQA88_3655 [Cercophora sp. LCS_1]